MKKNVILFLFLAVLSGAFVSSATLRYSANFDDQTIPPPPTGDIKIYGRNWEELSLGGYSFGGGRGGTGYSFGSGSYHMPHYCWNFYNEWYTGEIYVSFWMRYPRVNVQYGNENLKIFYPRWGGTLTPNGYNISSYVHWAAYGTGSVYYGAMNSGGGLTSSNYISTPGHWDTGWHRYEFYTNFDEGIHKFWYDRPVGNWEDSPYLKHSDNFPNDNPQIWNAAPWTRYIHYMNFGSIDAEQTSDFTRFIDDIEVWDGMPDSDSQKYCPDSMPEGMFICDDFEEGSEWSYSDKWNLGGVSSRWADWEIVEDIKRSGDYSAKNIYKSEYNGEYSSRFSTTLPEHNLLYVSFWFRMGPEFETDSPQNFIRLTRTSGNNELEFWSAPTFHLYNLRMNQVFYGGAWPWPSKEEWHKFSFAIDYEAGNMTFWLNDEFLRTTSGLEFDGAYTRISIPHYFKGVVAGGFPDEEGQTYWMDDIEIWLDKIPSSEPQPPPPPPPQERITVEQMIKSYRQYRDNSASLNDFLSTLRKWILFR